MSRVLVEFARREQVAGERNFGPFPRPGSTASPLAKERYFAENEKALRPSYALVHGCPFRNEARPPESVRS